MALLIDIVTLFPDFFKSPLNESLLKKARERGLVNVRVHNLRDWTRDRHKTADDKPFGGGAGMVLKPEPIFECVEEVARDGWVVLLDPQGDPMSQKLARQLAKKKHLVLIAGHYEGVDQRVKDHLVDQEISVGDFITMGGEAPAVCVIEAVEAGAKCRELRISRVVLAQVLEHPQYAGRANTGDGKCQCWYRHHGK